MLLGLKAACVLAAAVTVGGATPPPCTCPPPETETISCTDGAVSFPKAVCTQTQPDPAHPKLTQVSLECPPGETAISGGFRHLAGTYRPLLQMSPVVPSGGHAARYLFIWRTSGGTDLRVYITCQRD